MNTRRIIYILGTPYSGSTLLSTVLGSYEQIFNVGELHYFNRLIRENKPCSCGKLFRNCPFWKKISSNHRTYEYSLKDKISIFTKIPLGSKLKQKKEMGDCKLIKQIYRNAFKTKRKFNYILDASKRIERLVKLTNCKDLDVKVIYLKREIYGNVASFTKRKEQGFVKGLLMYKIYHFIFKKFLDKYNTPYIKVNYEDICNNPKRELARINKFLKIKQIPFPKIKSENHAPIGNEGVTRDPIKTLTDLREDTSWKRILNDNQKKILGLIK